MEVVAIVGVVDAGAVKVVGGARGRRSRPYFLSLPLIRSEQDAHLAISDLYNVYKSINIYNTHNMHRTINAKN